MKRWFPQRLLREFDWLGADVDAAIIALAYRPPHPLPAPIGCLYIASMWFGQDRAARGEFLPGVGEDGVGECKIRPRGQESCSCFPLAAGVGHRPLRVWVGTCNAGHRPRKHRESAGGSDL